MSKNMGDRVYPNADRVMPNSMLKIENLSVIASACQHPPSIRG